MCGLSLIIAEAALSNWIVSCKFGQVAVVVGTVAAENGVHGVLELLLLLLCSDILETCNESKRYWIFHIYDLHEDISFDLNGISFDFSFYTAHEFGDFNAFHKFEKKIAKNKKKFSKPRLPKNSSWKEAKKLDDLMVSYG